MAVVKVDRIEVLDGLRGYAVLCVFMVHFAGFHYRHDYFSTNAFLHYLIIFLRSHLGVDLFFAISGFLMCLIYFSKGISFQQFYALRLVRLAPAYVGAVLLYFVHRHFEGALDWGLMVTICLGAYVFSRTNAILFFRHFLMIQVLGIVALIGFAYVGGGGGFSELLANMLFLQYFFHVPVLLYVSWSLVAELLFYIFFFALKWVSKKWCVNLVILLAITVLLAFLVQFVFINYFDVRELNLHRYMAFAAGVLLAFIVTKKVTVSFKLWPVRFEKYMGFAILIVLIVLEQGWIPLLHHFTHPAARWLYYFAAAVTFYLLIREAISGQGLVYRLFKNRFFMAIGKVSYSFYLLHVLVIGIVYGIVSPTNSSGMLLHLLLSVGISYVLALFFYQTLENPYFVKKVLLNE